MVDCDVFTVYHAVFLAAKPFLHTLSRCLLGLPHIASSPVKPRFLPLVAHLVLSPTLFSRRRVALLLNPVAVTANASRCRLCAHDRVIVTTATTTPTRRACDCRQSTACSKGIRQRSTPSLRPQRCVFGTTHDRTLVADMSGLLFENIPVVILCLPVGGVHVVILVYRLFALCRFGISTTLFLYTVLVTHDFNGMDEGCVP